MFVSSKALMDILCYCYYYCNVLLCVLLKCWSPGKTRDSGDRVILPMSCDDGPL